VKLPLETPPKAGTYELPTHFDPQHNYTYLNEKLFVMFFLELFLRAILNKDARARARVCSIE
jgi:hypothetical protein